MKILMLAPQPFFEPRGTPLSVLGRLKALSELGHSVDLITYHLGQNVVIPNVFIHRTPKIAFINTISVGPSMKKLFLDIFVMTKAIRLLQKRRYDLLHTHEEASFFGVLLAWVFRVPHLYDMHSSLPQQLTNFRYGRFRPLMSLFKWLERKVINSSSAMITICPALEEHARKINGQIPHVMIENVASEVDPEAVSEEEVQRFKTIHGLDERKIVLYAGTFEPYQGIDLLVTSAKRIILRRQDILFLLMGGKADQVRHYQSMAAKLGLSSYFCFTGMRPPGEVPQAVKLCHVLVSPRTSGTNTPLKIYAYLRSGKPIVATKIHSHTQILTPEASVLVEPAPDALADGVLSVLDNAEFARRLGLQSKQLFESRYSFEKYLERTQEILQMAVS
jgi:glycosyltransferase involved in cell wall biosynthesis